MSQFLQKAMASAKQNTIDEGLAKTFQPFSVVDDKGFRSYTHALNPVSAPQKGIRGMYDRECASLLERVKKATAICRTTDCWKSQTNASYMSVMHHFLKNLLKIPKKSPVYWIV